MNDFEFDAAVKITKDFPDLLTLRESLRVLQVLNCRISERKFYQLKAEGRFKWIQPLPRLTRYRKSSLIEWVFGGNDE